MENNDLEKLRRKIIVKQKILYILDVVMVVCAVIAAICASLFLGFYTE